MGVLQTLPDEVLLHILAQLTLDAFYCLVRTCRTFMRLGHDGYCRRMFERDCQPVLYFEDLERHYRHYRDVYAPGVSIYEHHQFSTSPFKPPGEFIPPWSPQGQITGQYRDSERFTIPMLATHDMTPHRISYNIHDYDNRHMAKIAALLLKDTLCSPCWEFRGKPAFHHRLQLLMRPLYCTGCQLYHARALFSQSAVENGNYRHRLCIGWTGRVRICAHKDMTWREYTKDRRLTPYRCKPCKTKFTTAVIVSTIHLLDLSREQQGLDEQLDLVRAVLERSGDMTCPHYPLNDPTIRTYLLYTIRQVLPSNNGQTQSFPFAKPLLDCWGKPWGCPTCKSAFSLLIGLTRAKDTSSSRTLLFLRLIVSRPLDQPNISKPCDSRWLTQLEPSEENRNDDAHGVTWCDDATCGTSKQRRKEALLFWLVETGIKAVPQPALSRASAAGREHWLWFAFWWFLRTDHMPPDGEDDHQPRQRWLRDLDKEGLYTKVMGGAYRNSTSGVGKADWRQAALQHALTLYNDGRMADPLLKIKVYGHWKKYETYLKGERRRPLAVARDWLRGELLLAQYLDQH
ncbi:hypothetical protein PG985_014286 [Apiospora marii]|uniref:uncharacterized protein n=1 Tax=Apiospora marii TaxID=335849 RepID=UPI003131F32D